MTFKEKIDKILADNKLQISSVSALEDFIGAGRGAVNDFYNRNEEPGRKTLKRILSLKGLNSQWWETGKGPIFNEQSQENITSVQKEAAVTENLSEAKQMMSALFEMEKLSDYRFVPKTVLDGEYRIMPKSELEQRTKELEQKAKEYEDLRLARLDTINALQKVIAVYESEIAGLRAQLATTKQT